MRNSDGLADNVTALNFTYFDIITLRIAAPIVGPGNLTNIRRINVSFKIRAGSNNMEFWFFRSGRRISEGWMKNLSKEKRRKFGSGNRDYGGYRCARPRQWFPCWGPLSAGHWTICMRLRDLGIAQGGMNWQMMELCNLSNLSGWPMPQTRLIFPWETGLSALFWLIKQLFLMKAEVRLMLRPWILRLPPISPERLIRPLPELWARGFWGCLLRQNSPCSGAREPHRAYALPI